MRITLTFTLPEEEPEFTAAVEGVRLRSLVWEIDQRCRSTLKHGEPSEETRAILQGIRQMIREEEVTIE